MLGPETPAHADPGASGLRRERPPDGGHMRAGEQFQNLPGRRRGWAIEQRRKPRAVDRDDLLGLAQQAELIDGSEILGIERLVAPRGEEHGDLGFVDQPSRVAPGQENPTRQGPPGGAGVLGRGERALHRIAARPIRADTAQSRPRFERICDASAAQTVVGAKRGESQRSLQRRSHDPACAVAGQAGPGPSRSQLAGQAEDQRQVVGQEMRPVVGIVPAQVDQHPVLEAPVAPAQPLVPERRSGASSAAAPP